MGVSNNGVVVIVIIAAGFTLLVGISITRFFSSDRSGDPSAFREPSLEQATYMRSVRERNLALIQQEAGRIYGERLYSSPPPPPVRESDVRQSWSALAEQARVRRESRQDQYAYTYTSEGETTPRG